MLSLRIELLTGRYVASEYNNRDRAEWPPHPARVFSALVAAYYEGSQPAGGERALRWLETLPAPLLGFSPACARDLKTHFVPVNDRALSDAARVDNAWAKVLAPGLTDKQRAKAEARLKKAYAAVSAEDKKLAKTFREALDHVMPASRTKQPRTFPSVTPEHPVVHLTWDEAPDAELRRGLDALAAALVRIGHSSSLVTATWTDDAPEPAWVPDAGGEEVLRWVRPGQLDALNALHEAAPYSEQRVMPFTVVRYRPHRPLVACFASCFTPNFTVLRRVDGPRLPIQAAETVADAVRRALMSHADDPTPSLITGHGPGGGRLEGDHLAIAVLPYVEGAHASGDLLGVALIPPAGLELEELRPLYAAVAKWEDAAAQVGDEPRSVLTLGRLGRWVLERNLDISPLYNLREATWTRCSRGWASVTPVVLDRHPGSLSSGRPQSVARANAAVAASCRRIGLPEPAEIELSESPFFKGSVDARQFRRRPGSKDRRPLLHVRLRFDELVTGPVLLGAGRYRGLGLLRPWGGRDA
ncbi:CRISPR-associated protein, family [Enhygromyxa salina]|uniref:CRISPR-associated protein, family n=1 Tax=Enhygromyxa salina TaxID=215803 RepID=A0A2S9YE97_9BACT|nr:type I-U CRISPR-associated protein Csb2 [Enhygromyxa salina]PRQ03336.1 CRISPR-associated protein, family [Enhygromyxa salina]